MSPRPFHIRERMYWQATVRDAKGEIVKVYKREVGHSFLTQYYQIIQVLMNQTYNVGFSTANVNDTSNTPRALYNSAGIPAAVMATLAAAGDANSGIQVGTGNAANTGATFGLTALIATGSGAGQLNYGGEATTAPSGSAPLSFTHTRTLTNNSGGSIIIAEVGLVVHGQDSGSGSRFFMIIRDVLGVAVTVLNGNNVTFTLTMSYTIS